MSWRWERDLIVWTGCGFAGVQLAAGAQAQPPAPPAGATPGVYCEPAERGGPIRRAARHTFRVLQDNFIGYPSEFNEPPPGFYINEIYSVMRSKADGHRFTLYRSDFLDGTDDLSPVGASRFSVMAGRLRTWPGPLLIESTPDDPARAESRRAAVVAMLNASGIAIIPERVAIGPTSYPAALGPSRPNNAAGVVLPDPNTPGGGVGFGPNQSSIPYAVPTVPGTGVGYGPSQNSMPSTPRGGGTP